MVGPVARTASVRASGQAMPGGLGARKRALDQREEKSPEGSNPKSGPERKRSGRREGDQGVERARTLRTQRLGTWESPEKNRILCADDRWREQNPMRGAGPSPSRKRQLEQISPGSGLRSYPEGQRKLRDGWQWHSKGCRSTAARGSTARVGSVRIKAEAGGGETQMSHDLVRR